MKMITVREFLRGGYRGKDPVQVVKFAKVIGTWYPIGTEITASQSSVGYNEELYPAPKAQSAKKSTQS